MRRKTENSEVRTATLHTGGVKLTAITRDEDGNVREYTAEASDYDAAKAAVLALVPEGVRVLSLRDDTPLP